MRSTFTPVTYQKIVTRARRYVFNGGGLVPSIDREPSPNYLDEVVEVSALAFGGKQAEASLSRTLKSLRLDTNTFNKVWQAAYVLANAHMDAGFTFGAAVGLQVAAPTGKRKPRVLTTSRRTRTGAASGRGAR